MRSVVFAALPALLVAFPASAQREPEGPPRLAGPELFVSLAGEPFRAAPGQAYPVDQWFEQADRDGDGRLTAAEVAADAEAFFLTLDANDDGRIDGFEVTTYETDVLPEMNLVVRRLNAGDMEPGGVPRRRAFQGGPRRTQPARGPRGGLQGAAPFALVNEPHPVRGADADLDQRVTRDEFTAAARRRLAHLDADKDGALRLADLPQTPVQRMTAKLKAEAERRRR